MIRLSRNDSNTIGIEEAFEAREKNNPIYIDVRTPHEYNTSHVEGAINIPLDDLIESKDLPGDLGRPIITVCNRGNISIDGLLVLKAHGYSNVRSLNEGTIGWMKRNYPIVTGGVDVITQ